MTMVIKVGGVDFPGHGKPCNGCGACCLASLCIVASGVFRGQTGDEFEGPCPALEREGDRYYCGFMRAPAQYRPVHAAMFGEVALVEAMKFLMGSGRGCDLEMGEIDHSYRERERERVAALNGAFRHAAALWGFDLEER